DNRVGMDDGVVADFTIAQDAVWPDAHAVTQHHAADGNDVDVDLYVAPEFQFATHVKPCRIAQPQSHQQETLDLVALEVALQFRQLQAIVDAGDFGLVFGSD